LKRRTFTAIALMVTMLGLLSGRATAGEPADSAAPATVPPVPVLAYYYNWFDTRSWDRAKVDYPETGRYSSDDPRVIRTQIQQAKSAGIGGFIVSWKSTPTNNRRLRLLVTIAGEEQFKLAMIYQGLDFSRNPQPVDRVAADFQEFQRSYAGDPVFLRVSGKPLTIFSGTWAFDHDSIGAITGPVRNSMLVLSTEKTVDGYRRLADVTDGDAYYWSSVDPDTHPNYPDKLVAMSEAIHSDGKIWIAPFSPGFDARLVGGTKSVDRKDGETLTRQYQAAALSAPDAFGLISWNEYSENTHVEPSVAFGERYLTVLQDLLVTHTPATFDDLGDSSGSPPGDTKDLRQNLILLGSFVICLLSAVGLLARRTRKRNPWPPPHPPGLTAMPDMAHSTGPDQ
jgi:hypothetical protein